jgi:N-acetylglucosaminyldiphosphoundecaprenol N-acetyl-beta-D-mannosaminyltransferase
MGVGGLFDFYSGNIKRAPQWMREIGMEWFFRFLMEPSRMFKRYFVGNPLFVVRVILWRRHVRK